MFRGDHRVNYEVKEWEILFPAEKFLKSENVRRIVNSAFLARAKVQ